MGGEVALLAQNAYAGIISLKELQDLVSLLIPGLAAPPAEADFSLDRAELLRCLGVRVLGCCSNGHPGTHEGCSQDDDACRVQQRSADLHSRLLPLLARLLGPDCLVVLYARSGSVNWLGWVAAPPSVGRDHHRQ